MPLSLKVAPAVVLASSFLIGALLPGAARSVGVGQGKAHNRSTAAVAHARRGAEQVGRREGARADAHASARTPPGCYAPATLAGSSVRFSSQRQETGALSVRRYLHPTIIAQAPACAPKVLVAHTYQASFRYTSSSSSVGLDVLRESSQGWSVWYVVKARLQTAKVAKSVLATLRAVPAGTERLALALMLRSAGKLDVTGFSLTDVTKATTSVPTGGGVVTSTVAASSSPSTPSTKEEGPTAAEEPPCDKLPEVQAPTEKTTFDETAGNLYERGRWTVIEGTKDARSVHAVLLQNGKLLIMAGSGNNRMEFARGCFRTYIYNPVENTWKEILTPKDVFCGGHVQLANGNVLIIGGTRGYPPAPKAGEYPSTIYKGENTSWIFNIRTEEYEKVPYDEAHPNNTNEPGPLLNGAWYPSATELGNGNVISFGGLNEEGTGATQTNYFIGPYNEEDSAGDKPGEWVGWGSDELQQTYDWFWGLYPSMILTADGRLFYDGSHVFGDGLNSIEKNPETEPGVLSPSVQAPTGSSIYAYFCTPGAQGEKEQHETNPEAIVENPETGEKFPRIENTPGLIEPNKRDQSASLLLPPAQAQKVMIMGGGNTYETEQNATNSTDEIDLEEANPHWVKGPDLPQGKLDNGEMEPMGAGKMYVSAVALPDGTVLETGGSLLPRTKDVHEASIFNPKENKFTSVAADPVGRDYHSEALLLPDGRVMALGSNPVNVGTGGGEGFETRISIYEPPYLFKGERPLIEQVDGKANHLEGSVNRTTQWEYGSEHVVTYTSKADAITSAVLIRPAAVTHSSDPNQREVELPIKNSAGEPGVNKTLEVNLTSNDNIAPPGYYMLFLVNSNGVPSVAQWVHVGPQGDPEG